MNMIRDSFKIDKEHLKPIKDFILQKKNKIKFETNPIGYFNKYLLNISFYSFEEYNDFKTFLKNLKPIPKENLNMWEKIIKYFKYIA